MLVNMHTTQHIVSYSGQRHQEQHSNLEGAREGWGEDMESRHISMASSMDLAVSCNDLESSTHYERKEQEGARRRKQTT